MTQKAVCPVCFEIMKNTDKNKVWFDPKLSKKKKGIMIYYCTNHEQNLHFSVEVFYVKDTIASARNYAMYGVLPPETAKKKPKSKKSKKQ